MNTGRSRRSRPPTGRSNYSSGALSSVGTTVIGSVTASKPPALSTTTSLPLGEGKTGILNPLTISPKKVSLRPFTADSDKPTFEETHAKHFGHFTESDPVGASSGLLTRTALLEKRRHDRAHFYDRYDLDGDGVVDPYEVRLGALVDLDGDGVISQDERDYLRDLIDTGKLKEISFLQDKNGENAKKCMTWSDTKEGRRMAAEAEAARASRLERMKSGHLAKREMGKSTSLLIADPASFASDEGLLARLASSMEPFKDEAWQRAIRASLHRGATPMARVMAGRQTPSLEYKPTPLHATRSELLASRKAGLRNSATFDLDGDGSIDPIEHMVASMLDLNKDGTLSDEERTAAKALIARIKDHYITGLDAHGTNTNGFRIHQRDGKVMSDLFDFDQDDSAGDAVAWRAPAPSTAESARGGEGESDDEATPLRSTHSQASAGNGSHRSQLHTPVCVTPGARSIWSPVPRTASSSSRLGPSSPFFKTGGEPVHSERGVVLSRAGSSSLAEDLRRSRSGPLSSRPTVLPGSTGQVFKLPVPTSARPGTGMSHLLGV